MFAIDLGVGAVLGDEGLYGMGTGKAMTLGYRAGVWSFEVRFAESYDLPATIDRLADGGVRGPLRMTSATVRRLFGEGVLLPELVIGVVRVERPVLVDAKNQRQFGVGAVVGGALARPIGGGLVAYVEARLIAARWDNPPGAASSDPMDDGTVVTATPTIDTAVLPVTTSLGVRVLF